MNQKVNQWLMKKFYIKQSHNQLWLKWKLNIKEKIMNKVLEKIIKNDILHKRSKNIIIYLIILIINISPSKI